MTSARRCLPALALVAVVAGACSPAPAPSATPSPVTGRTPAPQPSAPAEKPFKAVTLPADGSWCDLPGAAEGGVRIGSIEAVDKRTVRFTLCAPDGAFPIRLADPVAGIVDAATVDAIAADPSIAPFAAGAGRYRVDAWFPGENIRLTRVDGAAGAKADARTDTIVLRSQASATARLEALEQGSVDALDLPDAAGLEAISTLPELVGLAREGMATAYLGFGYGPDFAGVPVRRAFGQGLDRDALAAAAFPPGSTVATHLTPCVVPLGCRGPAWYDANGPAAVATLTAAGFDRTKTYPLFIPSTPVPGVPDPAALGAAIKAQAEERLGVKLKVTEIAPAELQADLVAHKLRGLYIAGLASRLADPSGFLDPLFARGAKGVAADRADGAAAALAKASASANVDVRAAAFATTNEIIRDSVPVVPLAHEGSMMAFRADVEDATTSPLSEEPLGRFVAGDRPQMVLMQAAEPVTAWCAVASSAADRRLCALVVPGLLAFRQGTLDTAPAVATRCQPVDDAAHWTCRLRADTTFSSGAAVDAGDVVASLAAQADPDSRLRQALPAEAFAAWNALFGFPVGPGATPGGSASPVPGRSASPLASASPSPSEAASVEPSEAASVKPSQAASP